MSRSYSDSQVIQFGEEKKPANYVFRRTIINMCQQEYEMNHNERKPDHFDELDKDDKEAWEKAARNKMLGNIKFITL